MKIYSPVDFLIVCVLEEEISVLCKEFGIDKSNSFHLDSIEYWNTSIYDKHVRIVGLNEDQGVLSASATTTKLLASWEPWCTISFGIAGRLLHDDEDISLTDVALGTEVLYYEPGKEIDDDDFEGKSKIIYDSRSFSTDINNFQNIINQIANNASYRVKRGVIASGEKKIATSNGVVSHLVKKAKRKALAIEMEAAGVAMAIDKLKFPINSKFLVVKGLSDNAGSDENKSNRQEKYIVERRKQYRKQAAINAAKCLSEIIRLCNITYESTVIKNRPIKIRESAEKFVSVLEPFLNFEETKKYNSLIQESDISYKENLVGLVYELLGRFDDTIPIYIHWRLIKEHLPIHWVDFYFLMGLKKVLGEHSNICVHILITDVDLTDRDRENTEILINKIIGEHSFVTWYSKAKHKKPLIDSCIANQNAWLKQLDKIVGRNHSEMLTNTSYPEKFWARFIFWKTDRVKRCFVFIWKNAVNIWKEMVFLDSRKVVLLHRNTILLDGMNPKSLDNEGYHLRLNPPYYNDIYKIANRLSVSQLKDLNNYFSECFSKEDYTNRNDLSNEIINYYKEDLNGKRSDIQKNKLLKQLLKFFDLSNEVL